MLDKLDTIDWASLTHAYGSAADIPGLLRALASAGHEQRKHAIYELFGNIWHQGTVYPATAAAVPYLYELLNLPGIENKSELACLLASIAVARGYLEIHSVGDFGEKTWRKLLSEKGKLLEDEIKREAGDVRAVRQAASARLLDLLPYLSDPEPATRQAVAEAFGNYHEFASATVPALRAMASTGLEKEVLEAVNHSLDRLLNHRG